MRRRDFTFGLGLLGVLPVAGRPWAQPSLAEALTLKGEVTLTLQGKRNLRLVAERDAVVRSLALIDCFNVEIVDGAFLASSQEKGSCLSLSRCDGVRIERCRFQGSEGSFLAQSRGIYVDQSRNVLLAGNTFTGLHRGAVLAQSRDLKVIGNTVQNNRSEGFNFAAVQHVEIARNTASDFRPAKGDHPDFIQFWTKGTTVPSTDIVITGNVLRLGDGAGAQGIFMGNEDAIPYVNVRIERNLIEGTYPRAISLTLANDVVIRHNTVVQAKAGLGFKAQLRAEECRGEVAGNIANSVTVTGSAVARDNVVVRPDRYADVFQDGDFTKPKVNAGYRP